MSNSKEEVLEELESLPVAPFQPLTIDFFDRLENKTTKLVGNEDSGQFLKGRHKLFPFHFKEPVFVQSIKVTLDGYSSSDKIEFYWQSIHSREPQSMYQRVNGNTADIVLNEIVTGFGFIPPKKTLSKPLIQSVAVDGLTMGNFSDACDQVGQLNSLKENIISQCEDAISLVEVEEEKVSGLEQSITALSESETVQSQAVEVLKAAGLTLTQKKAELEANLEESRSKETNLNVKIQNLEDNIDQKKTESSSLNSEIDGRKKELKQLEDDINQFPAEFSSFVTQGGKNIERYAWFLLVPLVLVFGLMIFLFSDAAELSSANKGLKLNDIYTMLLSRLPFTLITGGIIYASYKLAKFLIDEIMKITRQRLDLTRIGIIAKEVSQTSMIGLDLTEKEKAEILVKLKMDILKSYLKSIVEKDMENQIELSIWEKFLSRKKIPKITTTADVSAQTVSVEVDDQ